MTRLVVAALMLAVVAPATAEPTRDEAIAAYRRTAGKAGLSPDDVSVALAVFLVGCNAAYFDVEPPGDAAFASLVDKLRQQGGTPPGDRAKTLELLSVAGASLVLARAELARRPDAAKSAALRDRAKRYLDEANIDPQTLQALLGALGKPPPSAGTNTIYTMPQGDDGIVAFAADKPVDPRAARIAGLKYYESRGIGFDVSRDGAELVYLGEIRMSTDHEMRFVDLASKRVEKFVVAGDETRAASPKLSFDRKRVAVLAGWDSQASKGVRVFDRRGNQLAYFAIRGRVRGYAIDWLPDGRLVYADDAGLWVVDAALRNARNVLPLTKPVGALATSATGRIAFEADGVILACDDAGGNVAVLATPAPAAKGKIPLQTPTWSPDGRHIAFAVVGWAYGSNALGGAAGSVHALAIAPASGPPAVLGATATRSTTSTGVVGGDNLSGANVRFVAKAGAVGGFNVGSVIVWR